MRALGMLRKGRALRPATEPVVARSTRWVRASGSGITRFVTPLGARVKTGEVLGTISDPFGEREQDVSAPCDGIVLGRNNLPLVNEGDALFHIALFESTRSVAEQVEAFQSMLADPDMESVDNEPPIV
jgi:predicted deacylase